VQKYYDFKKDLRALKISTIHVNWLGVEQEREEK
jgi:hypothetical protein